MVLLPGELVLEVMFILLTLEAHSVCTTCTVKPIFVYLEARCLLLFAKAENFVKYTFIYIIQLYFSTLLHLILPL